MSENKGNDLAAASAELTKFVELADELCEAVDCEQEDIGGRRGSLTILRELGSSLASVRTALASIDIAAQARSAAEADGALLAWLDERCELELSRGAIDPSETRAAWHVKEVREGSRPDDIDWHTIGTGMTVREALLAAKAVLEREEQS